MSRVQNEVREAILAKMEPVKKPKKTPKVAEKSVKFGKVGNITSKKK